MNWTDVVAIVLSAVAAGFSIWSFFLERNRNRQEATIRAFEELEKEVFQSEDYQSTPFEIETGYEGAKDKPAWKRSTYFLSKIEHFCVGIQAGTFDIKILNRLAGGFFIGQFEFWTPIIKTKRKDDKEKTMQHYDEFEDVVNRLKAMRKSNR